MAENLGQAELELRVNLKSFENDLNKAQNLVRNTKARFEFDTAPASIGLRRLEQSAKVLQAQFEKLKAPSLNLSSKKLPDDLRVVNTELLNFTRNVLNGNTALESNISGLRQQGAAFSTLAANVKVGTAEFKNFTKAAAQASQKQLFSGFEEIKALQQLFRDGGAGGFSSFRGTEDLLNFSSKVGNTTSSIQLYIRLLEQAKSVTALTDTNFARLTAEIERQSKSLEQAAQSAERYSNSLKKPQLALPPAKGDAPFSLQPPSQAEQDALTRQQRRQAKIEGIQEYISTGGRDTSIVPLNQAFSKPNAEALAAERQLLKEREAGARAAAKVADQERAAAAARNQRLKYAVGNAVIGGAFPALFGQGAGASVGGGVGGFAGGLVGGQFGFGLSLVGTAVGQRFDDISAALQNPIANFDALKTAGALSSKEVEKNVEALIQLGRASEANAIIQRDLGGRFGSPQDAKDFKEAVDSLNRAFTEASFVLGNFVAGPLADFLQRLRDRTNPNKSQPDIGLTAAQNRQRLTDNSNTLTNTGTAFAAAGLGLAFTGIGLPIALGLLGTGAIFAGVGEATRPKPPDPRGTQANRDREFEAAIKTQLAEQQNNAIRQQRLKLIAAEAQGQTSVSLQIQKTITELEKQRALDDSIAKGEGLEKQKKIADEYNQSIQRLNEQIARLPESGSVAALQDQLSALGQSLQRVEVGSQAFVQLDSRIVTTTDKLRDLESFAAQIRFDNIQQGLDTGAISNSFSNLEEQLRAAQTLVSNFNWNQLDGGTEGVKKVIDQLLQVQNELDKLNGKKATITVEQINAGVQNGTLTNNFSNLERRSQAAQSALDNAAFGTDEFAKALRAAREAALELRERRDALDIGGDKQRAADEAIRKQAADALTSAQQAAADQAENVRAAFERVETASDGVTQAQQGLRSALEGAFDLLTDEQQRRLESQARQDIEQAIRAGLFDPSTRNLSGSEAISAAQQARSIEQAQENLANANQELITAQQNLTQATLALAQKNWQVNVAVNANTGASSVQLG